MAVDTQQTMSGMVGLLSTSVTNAVITNNTEIGQFAIDPLTWKDDPTNIQGRVLNTDNDAKTNQIWLMGDGVSDAYPTIKNQVFEANANSQLDMFNMTANDIVNVIL